MSADTLTTARRYAELGYKVLPTDENKHPVAHLVPNGLTNATRDPMTLERFFGSNGVNVGILAPDNVLIIDTDDPEQVARLEQQFPELRQAPSSTTPRKGHHHYVKRPPGVRLSAATTSDKKMSLRGMSKAYVLEAPSATTDGHYTWIRPLCKPDELPVASPELVAYLEEVFTRKREAPPRNAAPVTGEGTPYGLKALSDECAILASTQEGGRNDQLNRSAFALGQLVAGGELDEASARDALLAAALGAGLPHRETLRTIESGISSGKLEPRNAPPKSASPRITISRTPDEQPDWTGQPDTDRANAERLERMFGHHVAYTPDLGLFIYRAGVWQTCKDDHLLAKMQNTLPRAVTLEAAEVLKRSAGASEQERKELNELAERLMKWAKRCEMRKVQNDALALFKSRVLIEIHEWDADPWLLNVKNGVIDLKTQTLLEHKPEYRMTKRAPVVFDPGAGHPAVDALLQLLRTDDREDFLRRAAGSSLAGIVMNEVLLYLIGEAGTGKSTLMEAIMSVLGDYAATVDTRTFLETNSYRPDGPRADLIALRGARLAVGRELPKNGRLNATDIKALTGRDTITARAPYGKAPIEFEPSFKLFVHSNYDLQADWDDVGVRRRLIRIPFNAKPERPDPKFKEILKNDPQAKSALLNWLLAGLAEWLADDYDLKLPEIVKEATKEYWHEMDPFAEWADDNLDFDGRTPTSSSALYHNYTHWCDQVGERPKKREALGKWLSRNDKLERNDTRNARGWKGVRIKGPTG
jgi:putative DNA primase/helicase